MVVLTAQLANLLACVTRTCQQVLFTAALYPTLENPSAPSPNFDGDRVMIVLQEKRLREENEQLAKNISCLFNTAQAEIARKDKWIDQLRLELQVATDKIRRDRARR